MGVQKGYTVWCDVYDEKAGVGCNNWCQVDGDLKKAKSQWKQRGWTFKGGKWFCPECSKGKER